MKTVEGFWAILNTTKPIPVAADGQVDRVEEEEFDLISRRTAFDYAG